MTEDATAVGEGRSERQSRLSALLGVPQRFLDLLPQWLAIDWVDVKVASYPGPSTHAVRASVLGGIVSNVLRMCQFKTNEYTQTTYVWAPARDVWIFLLNLPQVGNLECNNMASTNMCRLDSRSSVNYSLQ